jgi:hypothetical protein
MKEEVNVELTGTEKDSIVCSLYGVDFTTSTLCGGSVRFWFQDMKVLDGMIFDLQNIRKGMECACEK